MKSPLKMKKNFMKKGDQVYKWILIVTLVVLIVFAIMYMYNISKLSRAMEKFENGSNKDFEVVYVYSATCPHCKTFAPVFESVTNEFKETNNCKVSKVEYKDAPKDMMQYVDGFPTVLFYDNGEFKGKSTGSKSPETLSAFYKTMSGSA